MRSRWTLSEWRVLTWRSHRITDAFSREVSKLLKSDEKRMAWLVFPKFSMRFIRTESTLSRFRLEEEIANSKPAMVGDPTTNFWIAYKGVAGEYDKDMASKYVGDLDASLVFVSVSTPLPRFALLNQVLFLC